MKAVILAGGLGTRLKPFTEVIPKPLLPLGEKALLQIQIEMLKRYGFDHIILATNYKSDFIEAFLGDGSKWGVFIEYSIEDKPLGTCGPLSLLKGKFDEPFILMNGDILTKLDFGSFYRECCLSNASFSVATKVITTPFRFGNVSVDSENRLLRIEEKPELVFEVLSGIYCVDPRLLDRIPSNQYYGIDTLIRDMLSDGDPIYRYKIEDYWIDIGQVDDYSEARKIYIENFEE